MRTSVRRILYIEANEDGTVGGSHQQLFDLVRCLDRARYEPVVLFYQDNLFVRRLQALGVEVHVFESERARERSMLLAGGLQKVRAFAGLIPHRFGLLRRWRIDLIHVNNSPRTGHHDWLPAAFLLGIPCVASVMGDARGESQWLKRWLFRQFDRVFPVSQFINDAMLRLGYSPSQLVKLYHGVDLDELRRRVTRDRADVRRELGVADDTVLAVMVANVREWKGQHVVLAALAQMDPRVRARLRVCFVGAKSVDDESYARELEATVAQHQLEACVHFLGSRTDVPDLFTASDIALHASIRPEPGGVAILEAMAFGVPMVASNTGAPAETVTAEAGFTHDTNHPEQLARILTSLVENGELRRALAIGARQRAQDFSIAKYVSGIVRTYDALLPRRGPSSAPVPVNVHSTVSQ